MNTSRTQVNTSGTTLYNVCSVHQGMFSTWRGVQYIGGYHETLGDTMSTLGIHWGDIMMHVGDIMSISGDFQYIGGRP